MAGADAVKVNGVLFQSKLASFSAAGW